MYPNVIFGNTTLYDICLVVGIIAALAVYDKYISSRGLPYKVRNFYLIVSVLSIILGIFSAELVQSFYNWIETGVFELGGMTFYGGLVGGVAFFLLVFFLVGGKVFKNSDHKRYFEDLLDLLPCAVTIAHAFGRIGCLFAGCCYGMETDGFPGLKMTVVRDGALYEGCFLPTQLYEAVFLLILFGATSYLFFKKKNVNLETYLLSYGIWRFLIEFLRSDDRGAFVPGMTPSQFISICACLGGAAIIIYKLVKKRKTLSLE